MWRVLCDFNSTTQAGWCWVLWFDTGQLPPPLAERLRASATRVSGACLPLSECAEAVGLSAGLRVLLTVCDGDFEVEGVLRCDALGPEGGPSGRPRWLALPDWSTLRQGAPPAGS